MPISADTIALLRLFFIVIAVVQLAMSTVFFAAIRQRFLEPMFRLAESRGQPVPPALRRVMLSRWPGVGMAVIPAFLAWFVGTPEGARLVAEVFAGR